MNAEKKLLLQAQEALKLNQPEKAAEILDKILQANPNNDEAWLLAAEIIHDPNKRREYLKNAKTSNPENKSAKHKLFKLNLISWGTISTVIFLLLVAFSILLIRSQSSQSTLIEDIVPTTEIQPTESPFTCDYEAENATLSKNISVLNNHDGYSGSGFLDFPTIPSQTFYMEQEIVSESSGIYELSLQYTNGDRYNRYLNLAAYTENHQTSFTLVFPTTQTWSNWKVLEQTIRLDSGENLIRLSTLKGFSAPNLDCIALEIRK